MQSMTHTEGAQSGRKCGKTTTAAQDVQAFGVPWGRALHRVFQPLALGLGP
jgi:hypothetical protein